MDKFVVETLEYCRICLRKVPRLVAISKEVENAFEAITQIELTASPTYSSHICTLCERKIKNARKFREELIENETNLRNELEAFALNERKVDDAEKSSDFEQTTQEQTHQEKTVNSPQKFSLHIERVEKSAHPQKSAEKVACEHCGKPVIRSYYQHHIQRLHLGLKDFTCDVCGKNFFKKSSLASHMHLHLDSRPFRCPHDGCTKSFLSSTALGTHIRFHHTFFSEHVCETCGKGYKQKRLLEEHVRSKHTGERIFKCDFDGCSCAYFSMSAIRKHLKSHEAESATCERCGKIYRNVRSLKAHVRLAHSKAVFACEFEGCGKTYGSRCYLQNHMKSHAKPAAV